MTTKPTSDADASGMLDRLSDEQIDHVVSIYSRNFGDCERLLVLGDMAKAYNALAREGLKNAVAQENKARAVSDGAGFKATDSGADNFLAPDSQSRSLPNNPAPAAPSTALSSAITERVAETLVRAGHSPDEAYTLAAEAVASTAPLPGEPHQLTVLREMLTGSGVPHPIMDYIDALRTKLREATKQAAGWENDARIAQANWNAACNDIAELQSRADAAERDARRKALEEAAQIAESVRDGYSATIRTSADEQEFVKDDDGPWVLNADVARAIRALLYKEGQ